MPRILHGPLALCFLAFIALPAIGTAQPLEKYVLRPEEVVSIVKRHFRDRTGISLNFDHTEIVASTSDVAHKSYRDTVTAEDAACFRTTAIALEDAVLRKPVYVELIRNIAPSVTIGARDNSAHSVPDETLPGTMKPSTYSDAGEIPVNTVRIQPLIGRQGCVPIASQEFVDQLQGWSDQVLLDHVPPEEGKSKPPALKKSRGSR